MNQKAELTFSVGLARKRHNDASEDKMVRHRVSLVPLLIDAINMFKKGETKKWSFKKYHIKSIIILVFSATVDKKFKEGIIA